MNCVEPSTSRLLLGTTKSHCPQNPKDTKATKPEPASATKRPQVRLKVTTTMQRESIECRPVELAAAVGRWVLLAVTPDAD
jgi:hypothetical protein